MKPIEEVNLDELKEVCQELSQFTDEPIEAENVEIEKLIENFTTGIESLTEEEQGKLPDKVSDFYNDLYRDEAMPDEQKEEQPVTTEVEAEQAEKKEEPEQKEEKPEQKEEKPEKEKKEKKEKKAKEKKEKKEKKPKEKKEKKPPVEKPRDKYGFIDGSKNSLFAKAIEEKAMKMSEVKTLPWNEGRNTYYEAFGKLKKDGVADRNEQGEMFIIKK